MARTGKAFLYIIYFAVVVALGGFIAHSFNTSKSAPKPATVQHHNQASSSKSSSSGASGHQPGTATPTPSASSGPLANSGPGDVAGLFVAACLSGTVAYRYILINRLKKTG